MIPLRFVETDRDGFDEPVVELWQDDEFVGMVFWDEDTAVVQIYPAADGDVFDLALPDLVRVLDMAEQIVTPEAFRTAPAGLEMEEADFGGNGSEWADEHPATLALVGEFDPKAAHRSEDGEGFFPLSVANEFVTRCGELDLAIVEMEGFDLVDGELRARPNLVLAVSLPEMSEWSTFRATANAVAAETLTGWPERETLVIAFVVQQPDVKAVGPQPTANRCCRAYRSLLEPRSSSLKSFPIG